MCISHNYSIKLLSVQRMSIKYRVNWILSHTHESQRNITSIFSPVELQNVPGVENTLRAVVVVFVVLFCIISHNSTGNNVIWMC